MNVHANPDTADLVAMARNRFDDADGLCLQFNPQRDLSADEQLQLAQVQATTGLGHAVLALVRCFHDDGGGTIPVGDWTIR